MISVAPPVVLDTNSLWNFAVVERLDILETRYGTRAAWTDTIAAEAETSEPWEPRLQQLRHCGAWLGDPLAITGPGCLTSIATIQRILAAPGDPPTKHLGEAECIHIIEHELSGNAWFVTDDYPAVDLARRRGLRVMSTNDVLGESFAMGELACPVPYDLLVQMSDEGRGGIRVPAHHSEIC